MDFHEELENMALLQWPNGEGAVETMLARMDPEAREGECSPVTVEQAVRAAPGLVRAAREYRESFRSTGSMLEPVERKQGCWAEGILERLTTKERAALERLISRRNTGIQSGKE